MRIVSICVLAGMVFSLAARAGDGLLPVLRPVTMRPKANSTT